MTPATYNDVAGWSFLIMASQESRAWLSLPIAAFGLWLLWPRSKPTTEGKGNG